MEETHSIPVEKLTLKALADSIRYGVTLRIDCPKIDRSIRIHRNGAAAILALHAVMEDIDTTGDFEKKLCTQDGLIASVRTVDSIVSNVDESAQLFTVYIRKMLSVCKSGKYDYTDDVLYV